MLSQQNIPDSSRTDAELFFEAQKGNVESFEAIFGRYERKVYAYCLRVLVDSEMAADAYQEAFMRLYEHRSSYDGRNFMVWFFTIVRNVCLNMRRNRKQTVPFETSKANVSYANVQDVALHEQVALALSSIPHDYREAIVLYEYEGYAYKEIAEITGSSISTVKIRIYRGRKMLRSMLYHVVHDDKSESERRDT